MWRRAPSCNKPTSLGVSIDAEFSVEERDEFGDGLHVGDVVSRYGDFKLVLHSEHQLRVAKRIPEGHVADLEVVAYFVRLEFEERSDDAMERALSFVH